MRSRFEMYFLLSLPFLDSSVIYFMSVNVYDFFMCEIIVILIARDAIHLFYFLFQSR